MRPRSVKGSARSAGRSQPTWQGPALFAAVLVVSCALGAVWWQLKGQAVRADANTLCRLDASPPAVIAVLLDVTDGLAATERLQVHNALERARASLAPFGRFDLYTLGESGEVVARPRISLCNPGDGSTMSMLYQNPQLAKQRWERDFRARLDEQFEQVSAASQAPQSPLLESIKGVALHSFGSPSLDASDKTFVVVSDLLQHSAVMSHYQGQPSFPALQSSPAYVALRSALQGVDVQLLYIRRPATARFQGKPHVEFWLAYFEAEGAEVSSVKSVSGDL